MNILYVIPYVPSLIRVRPYNLIKYLSARGHQVTILTLWTSEEERDDLNRLGDECYQVKSVHLSRARSLFNCLMALPTQTPLQAVYCWQPELARQLLDMAQPGKGVPFYDILHVEHLRGARYGLFLRTKAVKSIRPLPIVWDSVDSISLLFKQAAVQSKSWFSRWLTRFEYRRTEKYERWLVNQFDQVLITSEQDRQALLQGKPAKTDGTSISVLPNGVDLDYFKPDPEIERDPATLVISGKMSYHANVSMVLYFVREIMPLVWGQRPDVKVTVVGKDPPHEIQALGQNPAIQVTGTVIDIRPYLQKATIGVVPILYGAGIQNKVLEAMACATPVVSSPQAVSALAIKTGQDALVAQEPGEFAGLVVQLLGDGELQRKLGQAGRRYVESHHNWGQIALQLEEIYTQCIKTKNQSEN